MIRWLCFFVAQWFWFRIAVEVEDGRRAGWSIVWWAPLTRWIWR